MQPATKVVRLDEAVQLDKDGVVKRNQQVSSSEIKRNHRVITHAYMTQE
jgi:hypothetical protein